MKIEPIPEGEKVWPGIEGSLVDSLIPLVDLVADSPVSLSSVPAGRRAEDVHLRDSLSGLAARPLLEAGTILDIGSGGGFPGLPLAVALPGAEFLLIDSVARKAEFLESAIDALSIPNARAMAIRSEELAATGAGREAFDAVTARAVAPLAALAELASPLLRPGGHLVAWKGSREPAEEASLEAHGDRLGMVLEEVLEVRPFPSSRIRNLYLVRKSGPTPADLPRRPGMARKRPLAE